MMLSGDYWAAGSDKIGLIAMAGTLLVARGVLARDRGLVLAGVLLLSGVLRGALGWGG